MSAGCASYTDPDMQGTPSAPRKARNPGRTSGGESRRSSRTFQDWRIVRSCREGEIDARADVRVSGRDMRRHEGGSIRDAVGIDMLHRRVAIVLVERSVIVVVMRIVLQVQDDMRNAVPVMMCKARMRRGERLPQQRGEQDTNDWRFAHAANLAETRRTVNRAEVPSCY